MSQDNKPPYSYKFVTQECEKEIARCKEQADKARAANADDSEVRFHRLTAFGALFLWNRLTNGWQKAGDYDRMVAMVEFVGRDPGAQQAE